MPPSCYVPGCSDLTRYVRGQKRHYFRPPRDASLLSAWRKAIGRSDDKELNSQTHVCHIHFRPEDIVKEFVHDVGGQKVVIPRDRWTLRDGAVPVIFPSYPKVLEKSSVQQQQQRGFSVPLRTYGSSVHTTVTTLDGPLVEQHPVPDTAPREQDDSNTNHLASPRLLFDEVSVLAQRADRFRGWSVEETEDDSVVFFKLRVGDDEVAVLDRAVVVKRDMQVSVNAGGRLVPLSVYEHMDGALLSSLEGLECFLDYVAELRACAGVPAGLFPHVQSSASASKHGASWHHKTCPVLVRARKVCRGCKELRKMFKRRVEKVSRDKALRRRVVRAIERRERMRQELYAMREEVRNVSKHLTNRMLSVVPAEHRAAVAAALKDME